MERDNFLDCIRALAVTMVLFTHYRGWMPGGSIGVSVFFCLSGFLICRILLGLPENSSANIAKFIFRRFMRVWPLMALQIVLMLGLTAWFYQQNLAAYLSSLVGLLTFTSGYGGPFMLSPAVLWTLRAEFWFYVVFAVAFHFVGRKQLPGLIGAAIAASWAAKFLFGHLSRAPSTLIYLDQLIYGVACAMVIDAAPRWLRYLRSRALLWASLAAIVLLGCIPFGGYNWVWYVQTSDAALWTVVLLLHHAANPVRADLGPIVTVGRVSFSIYLMHGLVLGIVTSTHIVNPQFDAVLLFGIIVGVSLLTYRWIELPFIRLSKVIAPFDRRDISAAPILAQ